MVKPFSRSPEKGADTLVWLADSEEAGALNGAYVVDRAGAFTFFADPGLDALEAQVEVSETDVADTASDRMALIQHAHRLTQ